MDDKQAVSIDYFSDVLCIWAYIGEVRCDQLLTDFPGQVRLRHRFLPLFANTRDKICRDWGELPEGFAAYNRFEREQEQRWEHIHVHPDIWTGVTPHSSMVPHLFLRAIGLLENDPDETILMRAVHRIRRAFFSEGRDVSRHEVLSEIAMELRLPMPAIQARLDDGRAHASLYRDFSNAQEYQVPGSPTYIFNEGRQRLYGNVGYRIIEANIRELLRNPQADNASWC